MKDDLARGVPRPGITIKPVKKAVGGIKMAVKDASNSRLKPVSRDVVAAFGDDGSDEEED